MSWDNPHPYNSASYHAYEQRKLLEEQNELIRRQARAQEIEAETNAREERGEVIQSMLEAGPGAPHKMTCEDCGHVIGTGASQCVGCGATNQIEEERGKVTYQNKIAFIKMHEGGQGKSVLGLVQGTNHAYMASYIGIVVCGCYLVYWAYSLEFWKIPPTRPNSGWEIVRPVIAFLCLGGWLKLVSIVDEWHLINRRKKSMARNEEQQRDREVKSEPSRCSFSVVGVRQATGETVKLVIKSTDEPTARRELARGGIVVRSIVAARPKK